MAAVPRQQKVDRVNTSYGDVESIRLGSRGHPSAFNQLSRKRFDLIVDLKLRNVLQHPDARPRRVLIPGRRFGNDQFGGEQLIFGTFS